MVNALIPVVLRKARSSIWSKLSILISSKNCSSRYHRSPNKSYTRRHT